jgi:hypothetical protein
MEPAEKETLQAEADQITRELDECELEMRRVDKNENLSDKDKRDRFLLLSQQFESGRSRLTELQGLGMNMPSWRDLPNEGFTKKLIMTVGGRRHELKIPISCPHCGAKFIARELWTHLPQCPERK